MNWLMKLIDRFWPVEPWEITVNGKSFGIYHARTERGALKFVPIHARKLVPDLVDQPIGEEVEDFKLVDEAFKRAINDVDAHIEKTKAWYEDPVAASISDNHANPELGYLPVEERAKIIRMRFGKRSSEPFVDYSKAEKFSEELTAGLKWNLANPQRLSDFHVIELSFTKTLKGKPSHERKTLGVVHKDDIHLFLNCWNVDIMDARWPNHITNIRLHNWPCYMNHRIGEKVVVDNKYIAEKYGHITVPEGLKKLRTL